MPVALWNVKGTVILKLQQHRELAGLLIGEVKADLGLNHFRLAIRPHVQIEDEIGAGIQPPGDSVALRRRRSAGLPEKEVGIRIEMVGLDLKVHTGEARLAVLSV